MSYDGRGNRNRNRIFVGGLSESINKEDLEYEFSKYGKLNSIWVAQNPPGFAFIEFDDSSDADEAVKCMNGAVVGGCSLRVDHSRERRGGGRGRGGGYGGRGGGGDWRGRGGYGSRGGGYNSYGGGQQSSWGPSRSYDRSY